MQSLSARRPTARPNARQTKRDPAPSKWAYRLHRTLLRPWVVRMLLTRQGQEPLPHETFL